MYYRFIFWKNGKVSLEHQLTYAGAPTGIWMETGTFNTLKGAKISARKHGYFIHSYDVYK